MQNIYPEASGTLILSQNEVDVNVKFAGGFGRSPQVPTEKRGLTRLSPQPNSPSAGAVQIAQQKPDTDYPLKIEPLPPALQWWGEEHFWLFHLETGLRVPGTWSLAEAKLIQDLSRKWDWTVDKDRRVVCGLQLLALAEAVCKRSSRQIGGEG